METMSKTSQPPNCFDLNAPKPISTRESVNAEKTPKEVGVLLASEPPPRSEPAFRKTRHTPRARVARGMTPNALETLLRILFDYGVYAGILMISLHFVNVVFLRPAVSWDKRSLARTLRLAGAVGALALLGWCWIAPSSVTPRDLSGKTIVITGCSPSGIGLEAARVFARWNATVICTVRSDTKAAAARAVLAVKEDPDTVKRVRFEHLDLASFKSVRDFAEKRVNASELHGLVLNAGLVTPEYRVTEDGFEETFQVNHLAQFLLTNLLIGKLEAGGTASDPARVIFVTATEYFCGKLYDTYKERPAGQHWNEGESTAYADTKLMNVLTALELNGRMIGKGAKVHASACSPGLVRTEFQENLHEFDAPKCLKLVTSSSSLLNWFSRTPERGAVSLIQAMTGMSARDLSDTYYTDYVQLPLSREVTPQNRHALWTWSESHLK